MRYLLIFLIFTTFHPIVLAQEERAFDFDKIYSHVLQGNMNRVLSELDEFPDKELTPEELMIKQKFYDRFRNNKPVVDFNTADPILQDLLIIYQKYWRSTVLDKEREPEFQETLRDDVISFLITQEYYKDSTPINTEKTERHFGEDLKNYLSLQGYFSATGRTAGIFDLFLWGTENLVKYSVDLPETSVTTTIVFLEDVITMGWEDYASFGKVYPGGWATKEKLYAVGKAYDTISENFRISYLKHESQHFADYEIFPNLTGADLEYRAKLTELIYAEETLYRLIRTFIRNSSAEGRNPHAFGNYAVIRDLSRSIFNKDLEADIKEWEMLSSEIIKRESSNLLTLHTKALQDAGAKTVTECIF